MGSVVLFLVAIFYCVVSFLVSSKFGRIPRKIIRAVAITLLVFVIGITSISQIPAGYTGIVTTFGHVQDKALNAGIHIIAPWDNVVKMSNREQRLTFQLEAFSKDIQQVDMQGSVNFSINEATAMNLYRNIGTGYIDILIKPAIQEDVKIIVAKYTAENLVENRQIMSNEIFSLLQTELSPKGINVLSLAIENIDFTDAFESAVEAKQVATQEKQRAKTQEEQKTMEATQKAERDRIEAQAQADIDKIKADAKAYATTVNADAKAYSTTANAAAEAEANKQISESLTESLIEYTKINHWDGKLPIYGGGSSIPIFNLPELSSEH